MQRRDRKEKFTKLAPRVQSWTRMDPGAPGGLTEYDLAGAMKGLPKLQELLIRADGAGEVHDWELVELMFRLLQRQYRRYDDAILRRMMWIAVRECLSPNLCPECMGRQAQFKEQEGVLLDVGMCWACLGTGRGSFAPKYIVMRGQISWNAWAKNWKRIYYELLEWLNRQKGVAYRSTLRNL